MNVGFDKVTNRVTGYAIIGNVHGDYIDLGVDENGDDIIFDFVKPVSEYVIQDGEIIHVGPSDEMISAEKARLKEHYTLLVQKHLDETARNAGYDDINSIAKYIGYDNKFQEECKALGLYTSNCWEALYTTLDKIDAGTLVINDDSEVIELLPVYTNA